MRELQFAADSALVAHTAEEMQKKAHCLTNNIYISVFKNIYISVF